MLTRSATVRLLVSGDGFGDTPAVLAHSGGCLGLAAQQHGQDVSLQAAARRHELQRKPGVARLHPGIPGRCLLRRRAAPGLEPQDDVDHFAVLPRQVRSPGGGVARAGVAETLQAVVVDETARSYCLQDRFRGRLLG